MTNEQLQNGAKLAEQIGALEEQLEGWKRATVSCMKMSLCSAKKMDGFLIKLKRPLLILML